MEGSNFGIGVCLSVLAGAVTGRRGADCLRAEDETFWVDCGLFIDGRWNESLSS